MAPQPFPGRAEGPEDDPGTGSVGSVGKSNVRLLNLNEGTPVQSAVMCCSKKMGRDPRTPYHWVVRSPKPIWGDTP